MFVLRFVTEGRDGAVTAHACIGRNDV